jgi:ferredoxin
MRLRRPAQIVCLTAFLGLLIAAGFQWLQAPDLFLRLDPVLMAITVLSARVIFWAALPAALVIATAPLVGRAFCGHICPMGTTLDAADWCIGGKKTPRSARSGRAQDGRAQGSPLQPAALITQSSSLSPQSSSLMVLAAVIGAALLGISLVHFASPLSLITRFYALVVDPVARLAGAAGLDLFRPAFDWLDIRALTFASVETRQYETGLFILALFGGIFAAARLAPRFWCRYLCPSGALLGLASVRPLVRRHVSEACIQCGQCVRKCPMGAIPNDRPEVTRYSECIACGTCMAVCPVEAVSFPAGRGERAPDGIDGGRRRFLGAGLVGATAAATCLTGITAPAGKETEGQVRPPGLLRPPGARPEPDFLARCVRCGECMTACPTNTLQPIWLTAGFPGLFSPAVTPRRGYCDPRCARCGDVCPTGAIRPLASPERIWARTGIAVVHRQTCLAWEHQKSCMVCDEVCPYDAIDFQREPGNPFPVPHVDENRCGGCGYCEHFCPVQNRPAITVSPMGALRLSRGSYADEGRRQGLRLRLKPKTGSTGEPSLSYPDPTETAPGFDSGSGPASGNDGLAPGFDAGSGPAPGSDDLAPGFDAGGQ